MSTTSDDGPPESGTSTDTQSIISEVTGTRSVNTGSATGASTSNQRPRQGHYTQKEKLASSEQKDFSGAMKDFNNIMGMRYEQDLQNKVSYENFKRNLVSHVECNSKKYGDELADYLRTGNDPKDSFTQPTSTKKSRN